MTISGGPVFWLLATLAVAAVYTEFICIRGLQTGNESFPDFGLFKLLHRCGVIVPVVEIADQRNGASLGSPYSEIISVISVLGAFMAAEKTVGLVVGTVMKKV